jgi:large conductance mechanosensitive channel
MGLYQTLRLRANGEATSSNIAQSGMSGVQYPAMERFTRSDFAMHNGLGKMWKEFKEFALKGSVIDLAIGVIIGAQFNSVVQSLVKDIIMPPIGLLINRVNFTELFIALNGQKYANLADAQAKGVATVNIGLFINTLINFVIVAFVIFLLVKQINRLRRQPPKETNTKPCPYCLSTIPLKASRCPECTSALDH